MRLNQRRALTRHYMEELASGWWRDGHRQSDPAIVFDDEGLGLSGRPVRQIDFAELQRGRRHLEFAHRCVAPRVVVADRVLRASAQRKQNQQG